MSITPGGGRVAEIFLLDLVGLDDDDAEVGAGDWIVQVVDFLPEFVVLVGGVLGNGQAGVGTFPSSYGRGVSPIYICVCVFLEGMG